MRYAAASGAPLAARNCESLGGIEKGLINQRHPHTGLWKFRDLNHALNRRIQPRQSQMRERQASRENGSIVMYAAAKIRAVQLPPR